MLYHLMQEDHIVLNFDLDEMYLEVIDNTFLPYELRDFVKTTDATKNGLKKTLLDIDTVKDYLCSRTLNLSRENAKVILNVAALPQTLKTAERLQIVLACSGLTMTDSYWLKTDADSRSFSDVNLRTHPLSKASYPIAILGQHVSATRDELTPDLSTSGMFPKYWHRAGGRVFLYKTDILDQQPTVQAELDACKYLELLQIPCVHYTLLRRDKRAFAVSECIATDEYSLISAQSIRDWCSHQGMDFINDFVLKRFPADFANMCIMDYLLGNTDRHFENWGFLVSTKDNEITRFAPLYDHNQSLLCDRFHTNVGELMYEPYGKNFSHTAEEMLPFATVDLDKARTILPEDCVHRLEALQKTIPKTIDDLKRD